MFKKIILMVFLAFVPQITNASVYISEIMYDLEGTDSDREWIEVHNDSAETINLSNYFLYENNVAHKITGESQLNPGEYAIIADSVDNFNLDWPNFSGKIFQSSFALNNTGEELVLLDENKNQIHLINYSSELGAKGDGNSLQLYEGIFIPGLPTPGEINVSEPATPEVIEDNDKDNTSSGNISSHSGQNEISDFKPSIKTKTGLGRDRVVNINSPIEFEIYISEKDNGKHFWNFGDGKKGQGKKVKHIYKHEGEYNLILNSYFKDYSNTSRIKVYVYKPNLEIGIKDNMLEILNKGNSEINIGEFKLEVDNKRETILKDTILSKGQSYIYESENNIENFSFNYPNGKIYYSSLDEKIEDFCLKVKSVGGVCNLQEIKKIFDRI